MTQLKPRERRHRKTKQAILDAARGLIAEKGIDGVSIRAIAGQIDYSPAGLYEYFDSKEEIIATVCEQGHLRLKKYMQRVDQSLSPGNYLAELGLAYIDFAVQNPDYFLLMFTNAPSANSFDEMQVEGSSFPILLRAIERGIEAGIFETRPGFGLPEMAYAAWAMVHGLAMLRVTFLRDLALDYAAVDREALTRFYRGLGRIQK